MKKQKKETEYSLLFISKRNDIAAISTSRICFELVVSTGSVAWTWVNLYVAGCFTVKISPCSRPRCLNILHVAKMPSLSHLYVTIVILLINFPTL